jgi:hypothetical protein
MYEAKHAGRDRLALASVSDAGTIVPLRRPRRALGGRRATQA